MSTITLHGITYGLQTNPYVAGISGFTSDVSSNVTIPSSIVSGATTYTVSGIGAYAFSGCTLITHLTLPSSIVNFSNASFSGFTSLVSISLPSNMITIPDSMFNGCSSLTTFTIPSTVTLINNNAFNGCRALLSITIPPNVTAINVNVFRGCSSLQTIALPDSLLTIGDNAFRDCSSLTSLVLPKNITSIGDESFRGCSSLTSINIPPKVTSINFALFYFCSSLQSIVIPSSVTTIGGASFNSCSSLTTITIPSKVTTIGTYAFYDCSNLRTVVINKQRICSVSTSSFQSNSNSTITFYSTASYSDLSNNWPTIAGYFTANKIYTINQPLPIVDDFAISQKTFGDPSFNIMNPTSDSDGSFNYTSSNTNVATIAGNSVTIVGAGSSTITLTQSASSDYSIYQTTTTFAVAKADPTIGTFTIPQKMYSDVSFSIVDPSSNSNGVFVYTSSNTNVATIVGRIVSLTGIGNSIITCTQGSSSDYNSGTSTANLVVNKSDPTLTDFVIPTKSSNDVSCNIVNPTSNSDGSFNYTSSNTDVATIVGNVITIVAVGQTLITATQNSTDNYNSGTISTDFYVKFYPHVGLLDIDTEYTYGDPPFDITDPSSDSVGPFIYISLPTDVVVISDNTVTIVGAGTTEIITLQDETDYYAPGTNSLEITVLKAQPTISHFSLPTNKTYTDAPFAIVDPSSNSDGSFNYSVDASGVADISGNAITIVGAGTTTIRATQSTTNNYLSGTIDASFSVAKAIPTITNFVIPQKIFGDPSFNIVNPSSNSNGTFSYNTDASGSEVIDICGNAITIVGAGIANITATQLETNNFLQGTVDVSFSVAKEDPELTPAFSMQQKTFNDGDFAITNPSSTSTGAISYTSSNANVATISGNMVTIVGAGTTTIRLTQQETDDYALYMVDASFVVAKADPTNETFSMLGNKKYGDVPFNITNPNSNSDGSFAYTSSNANVATIAGNTVTIVSAGSSTITATQSETNNYNTKIANTLFSVAKADTSIANLEIPLKTYGDASFNIIPVSNRDGSFTYTSSNTNVATIAGNTITIVGVGGSTIAVTQAETSNYKEQIATTLLRVKRADPTITNYSIPQKTFNDASFNIVDPSSNSTGAFSYVSSNTNVATIAGNTITIVGAGSSTISATQPETNYYLEKTIDVSFSVLQDEPTITNYSIPRKTFNDASFNIVDPSSNSTGAFSYTSSNTNVATIAGNTITIVGAGSSTISATQTATANYLEKTIDVSFSVLQAEPTITNYSIPRKTFNDAPFSIVDPSSNSTGAFMYTTDESGNEIVDISGNRLTIKQAGTATITATQLATDNYLEKSITTSIEVNRDVQVLSQFSIPEKTYGDVPFELTSPTTNSPGSFSYTSSDETVLVILNGIVTVVGPGTVIITATQSATTNYESTYIQATGIVNQSSASNPLVIEESSGFSYFLDTASTYGNVLVPVQLPSLQTTSNKVLFATRGATITYAPPMPPT